MSPEVIASLVTAGSSLVSMVVGFVKAPDPAAALVEMRAELAKLEAALGAGGTVEQGLAAHNVALDAAIAAEKAKQCAPCAEPAPQPTVLSEPEALPETPWSPDSEKGPGDC